MNKTVIFISHDASLTGAPIVLLHLLRWLSKNTNINILILLRKGGVLQAEFENIAPTWVWETETTTTVWQSRWQRLTRSKKKHEPDIIKNLKSLKPDLVYANTIVSVELGVHLGQLFQCSVLCHIHELELIIKESLGVAYFTQLAKSVNLFIAASQAVADNLNTSYSIPSEQIHKVHEFVPMLDAEDFSEAGRCIREELGIPADSFLVVGSGTLEWRKAPGLFIQTAQQTRLLTDKMPYFIWVGGNLDSDFGIRSLYDVSHAGLTSCVKFIGAKRNIHEYMSAAEVFVLTSLEDAYPLVCLEAASLGKPIICFANSGGMPEFVEQDSGVVVPYLRTDLMAQAIVKLQNDKTQLEELGRNAARKVRKQHTVDIASQQIYLIINNALAVGEQVPK